jgi:hypothetical protein
MAQKDIRLSVNFHQSFILERHFIASFLQFVATGLNGTDQEISEHTGIPVGKSSGKVPAIINYCSGMGLVDVQKKSNSGQKSFEFTPFGRAVLLEDSNISEDLTQWLVHLHLCRKHGGAEIWYLCFNKGYDVLGMEFTENELTKFLERNCGKRNKSPVGPLIRTYEEPVALQIAHVLIHQNGDMLSRSPAPLLAGFRNGYSAFFISLWEQYFPEERQVTITDFETLVHWQKMCGWNQQQNETVLDMLQDAGAITIDKQMRPWVLTRRADEKKFWSSLYDELA